MNEQQPITTLFLDIGNVLLTNGWDGKVRALAAETFELDLKELESRHNMNVDIYERGKLSLDDYLRRVIFYESRNFSKSEFKAFMFGESKPFPEMIDLICQLKAKYALKIVVVSNEAWELNEYRIDKFKLDGFVDFFISSCYVNLRKPDKDIFRLALDIAHVLPQQVIYIEDRLMFIQVAEELKIRGMHHQDYQTTCERLAVLGLKF